LLLDLENCDAGYSTSRWQQSRFPAIVRPKIRIIFDARTYKPFGHAGIKMIHDRYSLHGCFPQMLALYEDALYIGRRSPQDEHFMFDTEGYAQVPAPATTLWLAIPSVCKRESRN
jgi:hypothetical protein